MLRLSAQCVTAACSAIAFAGPVASVTADAAQRTFVASYGSDAASCALNTPCRSFGTAIAHTDAQGEIIVLDSAGYGRVTITKSVSIVAPAGVYAGISVFAATNGIDINGPNVTAKLRGLTINGQGGAHGISFTQGTSLYVEQCVVSDMGSQGIHLETGIAHVTDSTIRNSVGAGIRAESGAAVVVDRSRIERNGTGVHVLNGPRMTITNSVVSDNGGTAGIYIQSTDGSDTDAAVTESNISHNTNAGIQAIANGTGSTVRLLAARNTIGFNGGSGLSVDSTNSGITTGMISDNAVMRNLFHGIYVHGADTTAALAANAISGNYPAGVLQNGSPLVWTRSNNVARGNLINDIDAALTPIVGD